ncbi:MAG: Gfo/Idh/MocA family oxidoreductase [Tannerellaceae bacterium]|jgi:predicted dehydrogenase|nr:Gfo/Idh/MocA family oxidoreductase [Tannerellaceae bacterium]
MKRIVWGGLCVLSSCTSPSPNGVRLITLAPGHFHAALIQKTSSKLIDDNVYVYAPGGSELDAHLQLIDSYNSRQDNPAKWNEMVYSQDDFLERMIADKKGDAVILAGNNQLKTNYILQSVKAGLNVLADKPMAIDASSFKTLEKAYEIAKQNKVLLYDIMTERYADCNIVNRILMQNRDLFGVLQSGTPEDPAVRLSSIHHFYKEVSGKPLIRPAWYYDVNRQGEGIVDATTHLIDLVHWKCFPDIPIDYTNDIRVTRASHWPTAISKARFSQSTTLAHFPAGLPIDKDSVLQVYSNGTIYYTVKDVNVGITVSWNFEAPAGAGDRHSSIIKGSKAALFIFQGEAQDYVPKLYIKKSEDVSEEDFTNNLKHSIETLKPDYSIEIHNASDNMKELVIYPRVKTSHEDHFAYVADKFFHYLTQKEIPAWEIQNSLAKYYITTPAIEMARNNEK